MTASTELARRAVACKAWRWMTGMADTKGHRIYGIMHFGALVTVPHKASETAVLNLCDALPDLDDPATLGCLLARVREAWCDPGIYARQASRRLCIVWAVYSYGTGSRTYAVADTEAEVLVAALEVAP